MTRTDPLRFLEATDVSADAEAAKVTEFLEVFDETKLTRRDASRDHLLQLNLTIHDLEKCVKAVTGYVTQKTFDDLWARCHNAGSVTSAQEMTLRDLFRFRKWLGTPTGQNAVREIQHRKKLTKSGKSAFTADEMALKRLFTSEHEDLTREVAEEAAQRDNILARCRAKMERARAAFLEREAEIQRKYPVAGGYADPPVEVIKAEAWEMYLADCQKENKVPVVKSGTNLDLVFDKYGSEVRDRHLFAYLSRPEVKATLIAYGNDKIKRLRDEGKERALNTFRSYLALAGGIPINEVPTGAPETDAPTGAGGSPPHHSEAESEPAAEDVPEVEPGASEEPAGDEAGTPSPKKNRRRRKTTASARRESTSQAPPKKRKSAK
ncbi:TPA_asm: hypothetical protein [Alloteropsis angusta amalgavirus 1]|nr:TPA_asm: hypothetical protein [Alloteropsis angusta amalgavirus 1]